MKNALLMGIVLGLAGCAAPRTVSPEIKAEAETPLICTGKEQCDLYWQRSLFYVNKNSRFKVQTVNESIIMTYSPTGGSAYVAYNISKEPLGQGAIRIWTKVYCDNMFGCVPDTVTEIANLKRYVRMGTN